MKPARIPLIHNHKTLGVLVAPFHIKIMGAKCCRWCPAIADDAHTPACEPNKNDPNNFRRRQMRKASQLASVAKGGSKGLKAREDGEVDESRPIDGRTWPDKAAANFQPPNRPARNVLMRIG